MPVNLSNKICLEPFRMAEIHVDGSLFLCCPSWLPRQAGAMDASGLEAAWNSPEAQEIRRSMIDGSFRYCDKEACPNIQTGNLHDRSALPPEFKAIIGEGRVVMDGFPERIVAAYDRSCNLSCPSCRAFRIFHAPGTPEHEKNLSYTRALAAGLAAAPPDRGITVMVCGSGDPFASPAFSELLRTFDGAAHPNVRFEIHTNGTMFTPEAWDSIKNVHHNIDRFYISVDAATPGTYALIRRGGDWDRLMENLRFIYGLRWRGIGAGVVYNMIVQKNNFREMPLFTSRFLGLLADRIDFSAVLDWGSWGSREAYLEHAVWREEHPQHKDFLDVLASPELNRTQAYFGNLTRYREAVLARPGRKGPRAARCMAEREFTFALLLNPLFVAQRLSTLRSPGDLLFRLSNMRRLMLRRLKERR